MEKVRFCLPIGFGRVAIHQGNPKTPSLRFVGDKKGMPSSTPSPKRFKIGKLKLYDLEWLTWNSGSSSKQPPTKKKLWR
jgi:hypothetical protein